MHDYYVYTNTCFHFIVFPFPSKGKILMLVWFAGYCWALLYILREYTAYPLGPLLIIEFQLFHACFFLNLPLPCY